MLHFVVFYFYFLFLNNHENLFENVIQYLFFSFGSKTRKFTNKPKQNKVYYVIRLIHELNVNDFLLK